MPSAGVADLRVRPFFRIVPGTGLVMTVVRAAKLKRFRAATAPTDTTARRHRA